MSKIQKLTAFIGRVLLSAIFLHSATTKILDWQASEIFITNLICDWHASIQRMPTVESFFEALLPYNTLLLILSIVLEFIGAALVFFSYKIRLGAALLMSYWIPMMIFTSPVFFGSSTMENDMQTLLLNVAVLGGLFSLIAFGAGQEEERVFDGELKGPNPFAKGL